DAARQPSATPSGTRRRATEVADTGPTRDHGDARDIDREQPARRFAMTVITARPAAVPRPKNHIIS
ncbi:MAG: hypothetical protein KC468_32130, partial [Myxococcales bacterium]|nr:hypothetical protein [Myxococcales bacterium]